MHHEHQGMRLWVEPDQRLASGVIEPGSDVNLTFGVEPADASNKVQVRYRVNGGPEATVPAEPYRHVGNAQYFKAQLPCAALCEGDTVEYSAVCQCAGRQVPSAPGAERFTSSFRVMGAAAKDVQVPALSYTRGMKSAPATSSNVTRSRADVRSTDLLEPTHLSLFVVERNSGRPVARMPFYAEVGVTSVVPPPQPECKLKEVIRIALQKFLPRTDIEPLVEPLCDALYRLMTPDTIASMGNQERAVTLIGGIIETVRELPEAKDIDFNDPSSLRRLLEKAIRAFAKEIGVPLAGENERNLPLAGENVQGQRIVWAHPLGVLATDHVGYLSFDLTRLPPNIASAVASALEARRRDPNTSTETSIWLYPMAQEEARIDALAQMRFAHDAIVVKLELDLPYLPHALMKMGLLAMQKPDLTDWRLSPSSFAVSPSALLGEDGCENIFPANVALQEYYFYQVIGLTDPEVQPPELSPEARTKVRVGFINEYRLAWYPLGHSLGQIQYSLPLAPGESVNLAIIDWTRRDVGKRTEDTKEAEQLLHNQRRDRTITETVSAAIQEHQSGSSIMGGLAGAVGASIPIQAVNISAGATHALGGAMSDSSGSREITGNTVQKLSDNISQASAAMRELQSTVVVQSTQQEKESIETRTVVNYNHSHALTILYYEVLRHFRVVTERLRRRPALLVRYDLETFALDQQFESTPIRTYSPFLWKNRAILKASLLDPKYAAAFDALERIEQRKRTAAHTPVNKPEDLGETKFVYFELTFHTGGYTNHLTDVKVEVFNRSPKKISSLRRANDNDGSVNYFGIFGQKDFTYKLIAVPEGLEPIKWKDIGAINIVVDPANDEPVGLKAISVKASDMNGHIEELVPPTDTERIISKATGLVLETKHPPAFPPPSPPSVEKINDHVLLDDLLEHLEFNKEYYNRAVWLNEQPLTRAGRFDAISWDGATTLLEHLENRPVEIIGRWVAFPSADKNINKVIKRLAADDQPQVEDLTSTLDERLVTLPTRGIFAEAKLGHCNASEEIDDTRFWKWDEHAIPHLAPEIAAIQAGKHTVKDLDLKSTPFPQSMVNIVNPPAAPDPTGLAAALNVLGTPNIFRDMSGRAEVADLLKKLSDNSIGIAEAANRAREIQAKYGSGSQSGGSGGVSVMGGSGSSSRVGTGQSGAGVPETLHQFGKALQSGVKAGLDTPESAATSYQNAKNYSERSLFTPTSIGSDEIAGTNPSLQTVGTGGANSRTMDVKLRVFIPSRAVIGNGVGYDGDNRDFSYDAGTSRAELWIDAIYSASTNNPVRIKRRAFGQSAEYVQDKLVDVLGKPFWWKAIRKDPFLQTEDLPDRIATSEVTDETLRVTGQMEMPPLGLISVLHLLFHVNGALPLEPLGPPINCDLDVFLTPSGPNIINYSIKGTHDGFPAYELYIERKLVYSYDPVKANASPLSLLPVATVPVNIPLTMLLLQGTTV